MQKSPMQSATYQRKNAKSVAFFNKSLGHRISHRNNAILCISLRGNRNKKPRKC